MGLQQVYAFQVCQFQHKNNNQMKGDSNMADRIQIMGGQADRDQAGTKRFKMERLNDATGKMEPVTSFDDMDDMQEMMSMRDEKGRSLYETSAAFRETVKDMAANSPALLADNGLAYRDVIPTNEEMLEGMRQDAVMQQHERYIDKFGGGDLVGKFLMAQMIMNPTPEQREAFSEIQERTEPAKPFENHLKSLATRGEVLQWTHSTEDTEAQRESEEAHNQRILAETGDSIITLEGE
ncbi:MAG TPA: hypothetical protein VGQ08_15755 [Nitrospiraceae bacterium]|nr:hypothetical protein [Nitrospiraceae bacterium]